MGPFRPAVPRLATRLALLALSALLAGCGASDAPSAGPDAERPLLVFAAASLKESMDEAAAAYTAGGGAPVQVAYAGSPALARQIEQGAPADVFVSADGDWMDWLDARGLVDAGSRRDLLGNALVLVAPAASDAAPLALAPGTDLLPLLGADGRLALAMTASVPAGRYARAGLESLGLWQALQPRVAEAENVRAALLLVARGEAPLGVVYASDARAEPRVKVLATFPAGAHPPIVYPVARVQAGTHPQAAAFLGWLGSDEATALFARHGFDPH
ncbi:molybdate ABC transporter substrate-binding protein [uncultured Luteimonas sp.]|uniref:molybdate ABC transporter substrate-binding protein n=1 Tax=uncultured Luteimonas sp. TaxID=453144 RepID=UPI002606B359|nr:molybdate ABC transporter substrate-binding protein [uncultured Luteimonas sp.]